MHAKPSEHFYFLNCTGNTSCPCVFLKCVLSFVHTQLVCVRARVYEPCGRAAQPRSEQDLVCGSGSLASSGSPHPPFTSPQSLRLVQRLGQAAGAAHARGSRPAHHLPGTMSSSTGKKTTSVSPSSRFSLRRYGSCG